MIGAVLLVGTPLLLSIAQEAFEGDLTLRYAVLQLACGWVVSTLMALAFSGNVTPRKDRQRFQAEGFGSQPNQSYSEITIEPSGGDPRTDRP